MEDIDGGLHPAVDGQSLDEDDDDEVADHPPSKVENDLCSTRQIIIGTFSRAALGRLLRDGVERVWAFPSATMPS